MLVRQAHPFQRTTDDWLRINDLVVNGGLRGELDKTWEDMKFSNRSLSYQLSVIGEIVLWQQRDQDRAYLAEDMKKAYLDGALISYYSLIPPNDTHALPRLPGRVIGQLIREAPRSEDEETIWQFALQEDFVLQSMLDIGMTALGHPDAVTPAVFNGAGLINHLFNDYMARCN